MEEYAYILVGILAFRKTILCWYSNCSKPKLNWNPVEMKYLRLWLEKLISRPGWMELWATWSSGRCPCSWLGVGTRWSIRSLPTLTILWFYDHRLLQRTDKTCKMCLFSYCSSSPSVKCRTAHVPVLQSHPDSAWPTHVPSKACGLQLSAGEAQRHSPHQQSLSDPTKSWPGKLPSSGTDRTPSRALQTLLRSVSYAGAEHHDCQVCTCTMPLVTMTNTHRQTWVENAVCRLLPDK